MLCQAQDCPYLIYGYLSRSSYFLRAELKLLARGDAAFSAIFVSGDDARHYDRLMDDLTGKIEAYLRDDLGMGPSARGRPERNRVELSSTLGYWTPLEGAWSSALSGLAASSAGIRLVPRRPLFVLWGRAGHMALGLDLEYALGTGQPEVESFWLHSARLRMPVEAMLELGKAHELGLGAGPLFEVDTMLQARKYASVRSETIVESGMSLELLYRYELSSSVSVGLEQLFDFVFYSPVLAIYSPRLSVDLRLGGGGAARE